MCTPALPVPAKQRLSVGAEQLTLFGDKHTAREAARAAGVPMLDGTGLLPEQVWDERDRPDIGMYLGQPTGSARPLEDSVLTGRGIRPRRLPRTGAGPSWRR